MGDIASHRKAELPAGWLPVVVPLIFALAAAGFWFSHVPREREESLSLLLRDLGLRADFHRDAVDAFLEDALDDAKLLANFPAVQAVAGGPASPHGASGEGPSHFDEVMAEFQKTHGYALVAVFDRTGAPAGGAPRPASDRGCVAAAREVLASGVPAASLHLHEGAPALTLAAPMRDRGGLLLGSVQIVTSPAARLYPLLGQALTLLTGEVLLLAREGGQAVYLSPIRYRPEAPLTLRRALDVEGFVGRAAFERPESEGLFTDDRGERIVAVTRRLKAAPWALVVKVSEAEALEPFWRHVRGVALFWGAALAAALALAWGIGQRMRRVRAAADARSESRFRTLFEQASDSVFVIGADGRVQDANRAAEQTYGVGRGGLVGRHVADFRPPRQRQAALESFATAGRVDRLVFECEHVRADGTRFPVEVSTRKADLAGGVVHVSIVRDVSARKEIDARIRHLNRLLRTILEINQLIVRTDSRGALLEGACRILVEEGGFALVWVGLADRSTGRVVPVARAGRDEGYLDEIEVRCDDSPQGRGPVGTAIRTALRATIAEVASDASVEPWRALQLARGFRTVVSFPLRRAGAAVGALTVYSSAPEAMGEEEAALLDELADDLAHALDALEALHRP